jgi:serine/threonine protein kinase
MGAPVEVGAVVGGKYEVTEILGEGSMGVVVAARHRELDKLVALKFMHEDIAQDTQLIDRFLREARAAARLSSEHVGRVLDVGRLDETVPYIVMEHLEGKDLGSLLASGPLMVADACEYILQVCDAMVEAHAAGIVHRDLKPANLFLTTRPDGRPLIKVVDFGISKALYTTGPTGTHAILGTPTHMSPEQIRSSRTVDSRTDIWSLGVCLYQMLSGTLPFSGATSTEIMLRVMQDSVPPLSRLRPDLPRALVAIVDKCLAKDREARFDTVADLAHDLAPFAPERTNAARSLVERVMAAGGSHVSTQTRADHDDDVVPGMRGGRTRGRLARTWVSVGVVVIAAAGIAAFALHSCE